MGPAFSTRYWADKAHEVIGIGPSANMRHLAETRTQASNIFYRAGFSHQTGLPDQCASIVSCSQALHWMEPQSIFQEAKRILISDGIFAAYDYDWPPTVGAWETESAYVECMKMVREDERALPYTPMLRHWNKDEHLGRMQASGCFRYTKEIVVHHTDKGNAERLVGLLLSQGSVMTLLKNGINEKKFGIDHFREKAQQTLGIEERTWHWSSRVRLG